MNNFNMRSLLALLLITTVAGSPSLHAAGTGYLVGTSTEGFYSGQNIVSNAGFENAAKTWTATVPATLSSTTTAPARGSSHGTWDSTATAQTLLSRSAAIPAGMQGRNAVASILAKCATGTCTHTLTATDGTNNITTPVTVTSSTTGYTRTSVNFIFPSSGSVRLKLTSVAADEPLLAIDDVYLGLSDGFNLSQVSQARFFAKATHASTASCSWQITTLGSFQSFPALAACPTPTVEGAGLAPSTKIPAISFASMPAGRYEVRASGYFGIAANGQMDLRLWDGTTRFGQAFTETTAHRQNYILGSIEYTSPRGATTWEVQAKISTSTANIYNYAGNDLIFEVYYFPNATSTVYQSSSGGLDAGDIVPTASSTCPVGTIAADGTAVSRAAYPRLFARIGTAHGTGDGSTTFNLPDYAGRFLRGVTTNVARDPDYASRAVMATGGNTGGLVGSLQGDGIASHTHTAPGKVTNGGAPNGNFSLGDTGGATGTTNANAGAAGDTRPKNANVTYCVRTIEATPAPVIVNSVTSGSAGAERMERVKFNCGNSGSTITNQSGSWISSITNGAAAGQCSLTLSGGAWLIDPTCPVGSDSSASRICSGEVIGTTMSVRRYNTVDNLPENGVCQAICMGPK